MSAYVVIPTKGRPAEAYGAVSSMQAQTKRPDLVIVVGAGDDDIAGLGEHPSVMDGSTVLLTSGRAGLTIQRNVAVDYLTSRFKFDDDLIFFFDDDFRASKYWLETADAAFRAWPNLVGASGELLADGATGNALTATEAEALIDAHYQKESSPLGREPAHYEIRSLYGCNMVARSQFARQCRFDEALPLYGWMEDRDYSGQLIRFGQLLRITDCMGVHLGSNKGRLSGLRYGYSQIANPLYLSRKGTMAKSLAWRAAARHLVSNTLHSFVSSKNIDYPGRFKGNVLAIVDILMRKSHPDRIMGL